MKLIKPSFLLVLIGLLVITACNSIQTQTSSIIPTFFPKISPTDLKPIASQVVKANLLLSQQDIPLFMKKASIYQVKVSIADDFKSLVASESIQYTNNESTDLTEIYIQLFPNTFGPYLKIDKATINEVSIKPRMEFNDTAARFT